MLFYETLHVHFNIKLNVKENCDSLGYVKIQDGRLIIYIY